MKALFVDQKKAFDTIDHRISLRKLYSNGTIGSTCIMLKWFECYLTDRLQYVVVDGEAFKVHGVKCDGSMFGSLFFNLSIDYYICNVSPLLGKILYADNTCVLVNGNDLKVNNSNKVKCRA